jgi:hypothetical protein
MNIKSIVVTTYLWELEDGERIREGDILIIKTPNRINDEIVEMKVLVVAIHKDMIVVSSNGIYSFEKEQLISIEKIGSEGEIW